jgi:hypothetical protein
LASAVIWASLRQLASIAICASLRTALWVARQLASAAICASLRATLWVARRLASAARYFSDRTTCLSLARRFRRMHGSSINIHGCPIFAVRNPKSSWCL